MSTTTNWDIYYPSGTQAPDVALAMKTQAESVDAALQDITKSPYVICYKSSGQFATGTYSDVKWNTELLKQGGITHAANDALFIVPEAGIYQVNARVCFSNPSTTGSIIVNVNGSDLPNTLTDAVSVSTAWAKPRIIAALKLAAGDAVKIRAVCSGGSVELSSESEFQLNKVTAY